MAGIKPKSFFEWFPRKISFWVLVTLTYISNSLLTYDWNLVFNFTALIAVFLWNLFFFYIIGYLSYKQGFDDGRYQD
ncbi:MAG TPA: hypothetical protein ENH99_02400 [Candidatus Pacearchaeota archaeon]|nr:hypothetical protein [Candidatus Pacearchaeota archaeon]